MKKLRIILPLLALGLGFYSCDDYLDVNDSPNSPTADVITPNLSLGAGLSRPYSVLATQYNELGNVWTNAWAGNVNSITGLFSQEFTLSITNTFRQTIWNNTYIYLNTLQDVLDYDSDDYDNHKAIAKIVKAYYFQYLVDLYGAVPYSEAFQGSNNLTPVYDNDQVIYRDLIVQLDDAIDLINNASSTDATVGSEDVVFYGDMSGWVKFANTLKLRILLRESTKAETNSESATYLADQFAALSGAEFITSNVTINPGYNSSDDAQINPFYFRYGLTAAGNNGDYAQAIVATDYIVDFLDGTTNGVFDNRLTRLFATAGGTYVGLEQGVDGSSAPSSLSLLGTGLVVGYGQDGYMFTAAESYFLQAEAAYRGYTSDNAQTLFENGITASFNLLGASGASSYISSSSGIDGIGWAGSTDKLKAIANQKWIALTGINGIEAFIEFTRLGYIDNIPLAGGNTPAVYPNKPRRLLYPSSEYIANSANVPTIPSIYTDGVFWYVP